MLDPSTPVSAAPNLLDISGTGARSFTDSTIWDSGSVPGAGDFPVMAMGDGINDYVFLDTSATVERINVGNANSGGLKFVLAPRCRQPPLEAANRTSAPAVHRRALVI